MLAWIAPDDEGAALLAADGLVGPRRDAEFSAYCREFDLIDPMVALADPSQVDPAAARPDALFVLCSAVETIALDSENLGMIENALAVFERVAEYRPV